MGNTTNVQTYTLQSHMILIKGFTSSDKRLFFKKVKFLTLINWYFRIKLVVLIDMFHFYVKFFQKF
jgi:p-aminobenzoyl-glutamate transporter AbgT